MSRPSAIVCGFPANGFDCAVTVRLARPNMMTTATTSTTTRTSLTSESLRVSIIRTSRQCERHDVGARRNRDVLLSVDRVADRRRGDQIAGVEVPQRFAGSCVERADLPFVLAGEHESAGGGQHARAVV